MNKKLFIIISFTLIAITIFFVNKKKNEVVENKINDEIFYLSNIIKDVQYKAIDNNGNEYLVSAEAGETDLSNTNIIFLKNVNATIVLKNSTNIQIKSDFAKYNIENYDTIFNGNVYLKYKENKISAGYLDFSITKNLISLTKNVNLENFNSKLNADVIEMNLKTKDIKIYMYENRKKININSNY